MSIERPSWTDSSISDWPEESDSCLITHAGDLLQNYRFHICCKCVSFQRQWNSLWKTPEEKKGPLCALRHQGRKLLDCNCLCWIVWSFQFGNLVELNCLLMISISLNGFVNAPNERMPETVYACSPHVLTWRSNKSVVLYVWVYVCCLTATEIIILAWEISGLSGMCNW